MNETFEIAPACQSESGLPDLIYSLSPTRKRSAGMFNVWILHCLIFSVNSFSVWSEKWVVASLRNSQLLGARLGHKTPRGPCTYTFAYVCSVAMSISLIKLRVRLIQHYTQSKLLLNSIFPHCHSKFLDAWGSLTGTSWGNGLVYCITYLFPAPFSTFLAVYPDKGIILIKTELGVEWIPAGYYPVCGIKQQINKHAAPHVCNYCAQLYSVGELPLTALCLFSAASWLPLLHCRIWKSSLTGGLISGDFGEHHFSWKVFLMGWELGNGPLRSTGSPTGVTGFAPERWQLLHFCTLCTHPEMQWDQ